MPLVSTSKKPKGEIWMYYSPTNGNINQFVCNFCKSATFYRNATRMKHHLCNCLKCPKELSQKFKKKLTRHGMQVLHYHQHQHQQIKVIKVLLKLLLVPVLITFTIQTKKMTI